jgi:hypothetical protein
MQRMSMKMDNLVTQIKSNNSNQMMMGAFNKITNLMYQSKQPNIEVMARDLERFENCMDEMLINGKVMDEMMNKNSNTDSTAELMMDKLKMEMALEVTAQNYVDRNTIERSRQTQGERDSRPGVFGKAQASMIISGHLLFINSNITS